MEVTDRLDIVTQVTFQYDISSYCHSHCTLISAMHACMYALLLSLHLFLSLSLSLSLPHVREQFTYCQMWLRRTHDKRLRRSFFRDGGRGSVWHEGWGKYISSPTMPSDWPRELKAWWRAGDMPCLNHLTCLVMPATRPTPMGLSEMEMSAEHSRECINLLFIKCGVTWDWRLNGDLCVIQPPPWSRHMAHLGSAYEHCRTHERLQAACALPCTCQSETQSMTVKWLTRISCSCYFRDFHEATEGPDHIFSAVWGEKNKSRGSELALVIQESQILDLRWGETR